MSLAVSSRRRIQSPPHRDPLELLVVSRIPAEARPFTSPNSPLRKELVQPVETIEQAIGLMRREDRRIDYILCSARFGPQILKNPLLADLLRRLSLFSFNGEDGLMTVPAEKLGVPILRSLEEVTQLLATRFDPVIARRESRKR